MQWDVIIVGAGPAGCFTAKQLAASGLKVLIIEEHEEIGQPVQCAGLISPRALKLAEVSPQLVINTLTGLRVFSPLEASLAPNSTGVLALAIDRAAFDKELAEQAEDAGASLVVGTKVTGLEPLEGGYRLTASAKNKLNIKMDTRLLIGADGAYSKVAAWLNLTHANPKAVMYAADAELHRYHTGRIDIFLGQKLAPGWFGWVIPLNDQHCRVGSGYAFINPNRSPQHFFGQLTNKYPEHFKELKIIRQTGGAVPIGLMPKTYAPHAMLVGDAACHIKPISGGGIYLSLRGALLCSQVALEAFHQGNFSETKLARYQELWEKEMGDELVCGITHRENYLDFQDEDIDRVIRFLSKPRWQKMIEKYGDIDYPSLLAKRLFSLGPWKNSFFKVALKMADHAQLL